MLSAIFSNFGRPSFDLGNDAKIHEADDVVTELENKTRELERRLKLLEIQSKPRGSIND